MLYYTSVAARNFSMRFYSLKDLRFRASLEISANVSPISRHIDRQMTGNFHVHNNELESPATNFCFLSKIFRPFFSRRKLETGVTIDRFDVCLIRSVALRHTRSSESAICLNVKNGLLFYYKCPL